MSYLEAWVRYAGGPEALIFPRDAQDFQGFMIAKFVVGDVTAGKQTLASGTTITIKGDMPSLSKTFSYLLRFKRDTGSAGAKKAFSIALPDKGGGGKRGLSNRAPMPTFDSREESYVLLPKAGFRDARRIPWNYDSLGWSLCNEVKGMPAGEVRSVLSAVFPSRDKQSIPEKGGEEGVVAAAVVLSGEKLLATLPCYGQLVESSDYYRLQKIVLLKRGWPSKLIEIRKLPTATLEKLSEHIASAPHELCFRRHVKEYGLGEMSFACLKDVVEEMKGKEGVPKSCGNLQMAAACFYNSLREERNRYGHTSFLRDSATKHFSIRHTGDSFGSIAVGAMMWLARNEHLYFVNASGVQVPQEEWFASAEGEKKNEITDIQFPADYKLKQRISGHLKRVHANFEASKGQCSVRLPNTSVPAVPGGALNAKQCAFIDHMLNNWLTILQGGPGSGKTFSGIVYPVCYFDWTEILTHVGRQAVALCDLLGGHNENARTIHSQCGRYKMSVLVKEYAEKKDLLIMDEVYNADDWTFEKGLAMAPEASRIILVGDPDQIRPIPGEKGAGTPALDIAKAFFHHVIFLDENMRQRADARAIHHVVTAVRTKRPEMIEWGSDLDKDAVVLMNPSIAVTAGAAVKLQPAAHLPALIARLRRGVPREGGAAEHTWQLITFYNGNNPDSQGEGIKQLNAQVESYFERTGFFRNKARHRITSNLTMYEGFKFIVGAKFYPDQSILRKTKTKRPTKKCKRVAGSKSRDGGGVYVLPEDEEGTLGGNGQYEEVMNGQIEVVQSIRQIKIKKQRGACWDVLCYPRGKRKQGTRFLINSALHVDPGKIYPAWAVTSNKSMGGECNNVGVFIPPEVRG